MRRIALVLAFCFAISPLAATAATKVVHPKPHKVKGHKAPKVKKASKRSVKHNKTN